MNITKYLSSSKEESARRGHDTGVPASHQFTNHTKTKFREDDACPPGLKSENCGPESKTEEISKNHEDLSRTAKYIAKKNNSVGDVPSKAKKLALKRKLKVKQSRQQTKCSRSEILRLRTRCSLLEDAVAELRKTIQRLDKRCFVLPAEIGKNVEEDTSDREFTIYSSEKSEESSCNTVALPEKHNEQVSFVETAVNSVGGAHLHQSLTNILLEKSNNGPCNTNTRLSEQLSEKVAAASTEMTGNGTEVVCNANLTMFSNVECNDRLSNTDAEWPKNHPEKVSLVEYVEKVAEDGYYTDLSLATIDILSDDLHTSEKPLEQFSEEGCSRYSAQGALVEFIEQFTDDYISAESFMLPLELSSVDLHDSGEQLENFFDEVALVETAHDISEDVHNTNLSISSREKSNHHHDMNKAAEQYSEGVALNETSAHTHVNENENTFNTNFIVSCLENPDNSLHNADARPAQYFGEDSASKDSRNCISDPTKETDYVFSNIPDDDEVVSGISASPQINCPFRKSDTATSSNNEQFDKTHVMKTLRIELVRVSTQQPNCNNKLNLCQRNEQASSSPKCSKRRKNGVGGRITCSEKNKKELSSSATTIETSDSVPKKVLVGGVLMQDTPPYCCNICDKMFSEKSDWTQHQREHSKPFLCPKCEKPFDKKHIFLRHLASHSEKKPYKCSVCSAGFKHNDSKLQHERNMHTEIVCFECAVCGKMFNHKNNMIKHQRIHSAVKPFQCQTCGTRFSSNQHLVSHQKMHSKEKKFKCRICDKLFKHQHAKTTHERLHEEGPRFECALCGKKYTRKMNLAHHISSNCRTSQKMVSKLFHRNEVNVERVDEDNQFSNSTAFSQKLNANGPCNAEAQSQQCSEKDPGSKDSHNCFSNSTKATDYVSLNILDDDEILNGISAGSQINCQLGRNDIATSSNNEQSDETHVGQTLKMKQVQVTSQQSNRNDELNVCQRNEKVSSSAGCSKRRGNGGEDRSSRSAKKKKAFPSIATMIQTSDSAPKKVRGILMQDSPPYCCSICDKTFSDKRVLKRHQREHSKPFLCSKCKKPFAKLYLLNTHHTTHSEMRPYKCDICDSRFKNNAAKTAHQRVHVVGARFECAVCGKMFFKKGSLIYHLKIHSGQKPFRCQTCGASFSQKTNLFSHQITHSKERNFKCRICNKVFKHQQNRTKHERSHLEGSRFECALCGKKYRQKHNLAHHISSNCIVRFQ